MKSKFCMQLFCAVVLLSLSMSAVAGVKLDKITSETELEYFIQTYYMHPQPELVPLAIEYYSASKLLSKYKNTALPTSAFFSKLFLGNPLLISDWKKLIEKQDAETRAVLVNAINNTPEQLAKQADTGMAQNDIFWGAFFASGEVSYLNKIIDQLKYLDERKDISLYLTAATAKWSLSSNLRNHPKVKMELEAFKRDGVDKMRALAEEILTKSPAQIKDEIKMVINENQENWVQKQ